MWSFSDDAAYLCLHSLGLGGAAASGHIILCVGSSGALGIFTGLQATSPHPSPPLPPEPLLSFALHPYLFLSPLARYTPDCTPAETLRKMPSAVSVLNFSEIPHSGCAHVRSSFSTQSRQLEPLRTRDLSKELAAQTAIHLQLICSLHFVCSRSFDRRDGTCPAYFPTAYFPTIGLRICAHAPSKPSVSPFANFALWFHA